MDEIAPEYDVVVLGTGIQDFHQCFTLCIADDLQGLTECVLSGYAAAYL